MCICVRARARVCRPLRLVVLGRAPGLPSPLPFQVSSMVAVRRFRLFGCAEGEMGDGEMCILLGFHSGWRRAGQFRHDVGFK